MSDPNDIDPLAAALRDMASSASGHNNDELVPAGERPCPICGVAMNVIDEHNIAVDICDQHGVWLDQGELTTLLERTYRYRRESELARIKSDRNAMREQTADKFSRSMQRAIGCV